MNIYLDGFKENITETIFSLSFKTWLKTTGAYAIMYGITSLIVLSFFTLIISNTGIFTIDDLSNIQSLSDKISMYGNSIFTPITILLFIVIVILSTAIYSWATYFSLVLTDKEANEEDTNFLSVLKQSISPKIFSLFGVTLLLQLMLSAAIILSLLFVKLSGLITLVLFFMIIITMLRLTLVIPAYTIKNHSLSESFSFSLQNITWLRSLKLFGIILLVSLALLVIIVVISAISFIFNLIPYFGTVIKTAIPIFISSFTLALLSASMIGLYYRFSNPQNIIKEEDSTEISEMNNFSTNIE
ncbi:MAG: hypothetical protein WCK02_12370 [Bacteroidota bacterium]